jgi:hypothetical protein
MSTNQNMIDHMSTLLKKVSAERESIGEAPVPGSPVLGEDNPSPGAIESSSTEKSISQEKVNSSTALAKVEDADKTAQGKNVGDHQNKSGVTNDARTEKEGITAASIGTIESTPTEHKTETIKLAGELSQMNSQAQRIGAALSKYAEQDSMQKQAEELTIGLAHVIGMQKRAEDIEAIQSELGVNEEDANAILDQAIEEDPSIAEDVAAEVAAEVAAAQGGGGSAEEAEALMALAEQLEAEGVTPEELAAAIEEVDAEEMAAAQGGVDPELAKTAYERHSHLKTIIRNIRG